MFDRKKVFIAAILIGTFLLTDLFASSLDVFKGETGSIKISGGTAHIPVMKEAAKRIMQLNGSIHISIAV